MGWCSDSRSYGALSPGSNPTGCFPAVDLDSPGPGSTSLWAGWQTPLGLAPVSLGLVVDSSGAGCKHLWGCLSTPGGLTVSCFLETGLWLAFKPGLRPGLRPVPRAGLRAGLKPGGRHSQPEPARGSHNIHMGMHKSMHMCMCMCMCMCMFASAHKSTNPSSHVHEDPCMTQLKTLSWHTCTWAGFRLQ